MFNRGLASLLSVELGNFREDAVSAAKFPRSRVKGSSKFHGTRLEFREARTRDVKLLLHKFLHHQKLDGYRIVVVHPGLIEVLRAKQEKVRIRPAKRPRGRRVPATPTIPQYWVAAATGGKMPQPKTRKFRP